ncbi:hypothetical protein NDU88_003181 [Pleurodeles waltl]|uniref:Uncharacterized protein n=1 Tax=Pleurodeles waltl TaxID=8319 RepID=A0AAV7PBJ9_PLEWA|nr:hypothetical protein NDU88_003181 [Pleurodeles waltl]
MQSSQVSNQEKEQSGTARKATRPECKHTHSPNRGQPSGRRAPIEDQVTSGDSPVGATQPCALALGQGNMENADANVELDIEEIIKAAREAATTHSKDWILKQIKGAGSDEKKTRDERDDIRTTGTA